MKRLRRIESLILIQNVLLLGIALLVVEPDLFNDIYNKVIFIAFYLFCTLITSIISFVSAADEE